MGKRVLDKALGHLPMGFGFGVAAVDPETGDGRPETSPGHWWTQQGILGALQ